jgi:phospholipid/cholesterol/gamma-HCH transport system permease protein
LLSGRIGAGIGAELGAMRVTEQIDALEASAVDAFKYLVVTRALACVIALPILTTTDELLRHARRLPGRARGHRHARCGSTSNRSFSVIDVADYVPATLKTTVFGFIIAITSSYLGFTTSSGTEGVGARRPAPSCSPPFSSLFPT